MLEPDLGDLAAPLCLLVAVDKAVGKQRPSQVMAQVLELQEGKAQAAIPWEE